MNTFVFHSLTLGATLCPNSVIVHDLCCLSEYPPNESKKKTMNKTKYSKISIVQQEITKMSRIVIYS